MKTPLEICEAFSGDKVAQYIGHTWHKYNMERLPKINEWKELRNYIFATDTQTTTNKTLPWKNSTTIPKICQVRDNLHSNYISALFPNDQWLSWEAYSSADNIKSKVRAIESYMSNKCREGHFRTEMSKILYDYIDFGNAFGTVSYENSTVVNSAGETVPSFIGPRLIRISPLDIVFNPLAASFRDSFKVIRSLKSIGVLKDEAASDPDKLYLKSALANREKMLSYGKQYGWEDINKAEGFMVMDLETMKRIFSKNMLKCWTSMVM